MTWQPRRTRPIRAVDIKREDIIQSNLGTSWLSVVSTRFDRYNGYIEMFGYEVIDVDERGNVTTGTERHRLSATPSELRVFGW